MCRPTSPVHSMRPARDSHWPERLHGDETRTIREYAEQNTKRTPLTLSVGGERHARRWHQHPLANEPRQ